MQNSARKPRRLMHSVNRRDSVPTTSTTNTTQARLILPKNVTNRAAVLREKHCSSTTTATTINTSIVQKSQMPGSEPRANNFFVSSGEPPGNTSGYVKK